MVMQIKLIVVECQFHHSEVQIVRTQAIDNICIKTDFNRLGGFFLNELNIVKHVNRVGKNLAYFSCKVEI